MPKSKGRKIKKNKIKKRIETTPIKRTVQTKHNIGLYKILKSRLVTLPYGRITLIEDQLVLCPHQLQIEKQLVKVIEDCFEPLKETTNLYNKKLLIHRYGGAGDLLCILPGISELRSKFNDKTLIGMMCSKTYSDILRFFPSIINGSADSVTLWDSVKQFTHFVDLDGAVEVNKDPEKPIHNIYAEKLYQEVTYNSIQSVIQQNISGAALQRSGIGVQYSSNAPIRDYDLEKIALFLNLLQQQYPNEPIHLLGQADDYLAVNYLQTKTNGGFIPNGCGFKKRTFDESFSLVGSLKLVIAPDSSMIHFAGFNNTPVIGLYGPFKSSSRLSYYNYAVGIDGQAICRPCQRHSPLQWCMWNGGQAKCTNSITPELILEQVEYIMKQLFSEGITNQ